MTRRGSPRWGFESIVDKIPIQKETIQYIEKKTGIILKNELADGLNESLSAYLSTKEVISNFPRLSESKAALKEISSIAERFIYLLKELDSRSRMILTLQSDWVNVEKTIFNLEILHSATEDALNSLPPDKGGRLPDLALKSLIKDLIEIYEYATGKKAGEPYQDHYTEEYSGPFFRFVDTCVKEIKCPAHSSGSLAQEIKRILIDHKKSS